MSLPSLIRADLRRSYPRANRLKKAAAMVINPSIRAIFLVRVAQISPAWMFWLIRGLLVSLHGIDVGRGFQIGPGLSLPHPIGIVIGGGVSMGSGCTIFQNVTLGVSRGEYPILGDRVTVYPNSVLVGALQLPHDHTVRPCTLLYPCRSET